MGRCIGIDLGTKRVGLALSDSLNIIASPFKTLTYDRKEKNSPIQTIVERQAQLEAVKYVDEVIIYCTEADLLDIINMYPINVRILGEEYRTQNFTGKDECRNRGIDLYFNKRDHRFSSSGLRSRVCDNHK